MTDTAYLPEPSAGPAGGSGVSDAADTGQTAVTDAGADIAGSAKRHVAFVRLEDLKGDPKNPKSHSLDMIDQSFSRFGMVDLISVDGRTGYIISGHGRTTALRDAFAKGELPPEGIELADDGSWLVPVNSGWRSKNDAEAAAALIAMNRVTELGGWVDDSLLALLEEISEAGAGFEGVGYGEDDLEDLRSYLDTEHMATTFDPDSANADDDGTDLGESVDLFSDQVVVNVVLKEADRPALYALLKDLPWIVDIRNSNGR